MRKPDPVVECIAATLEGLSLKDYRDLVAIGFNNRIVLIKRKHDLAEARRIKRALARAGMLKEERRG